MEMRIYDGRPTQEAFEHRAATDKNDPATFIKAILKVKHYGVRCYWSPHHKIGYRLRRDGRITAFYVPDEAIIPEAPAERASDEQASTTTNSTTTTEESTMQNNTATVFHVHLLRKEGAVELAKKLGMRRDWARAKLSEIRDSLRVNYPPTQLAEAVKALPDYFDEEDLAILTDPNEGDSDTPPAAEQATEQAATVATEERPVTTTVAAAVSATTATPKVADAPSVAKVAALLADLLATGKAGLDASEVREIVEPMLHDFGGKLLCAVDAKVAAIPAREIIVKSERAEVKLEGLQHHQFETLLRTCAARQPDGHRLNVWLYGPPGTGKTTAARNVAKALNLPFYCNGSLSTKYELIGFIDAGGKYQSTPFRQAWEQGGVYLYDEFDGSDPKAGVAFNAALANGVMAFPDGMVERHPDCVVIAASNTIHGATSEFTGRMKPDAATLDRFVILEWGIDDALEEAMAPNHKSWVKTVQKVRAKVREKGIKVQITPRATLYGASLLEQGMPMDMVKSAVLRKGMTTEQWNLIEG